MNAISEINILDLIPQRPPFIMIDRLVSFDPVVTESEFTVREDGIFYEAGRFQESGLIEVVAQTCAARIGYANLLQKDTVKLGFIGSVRDLEIKRAPQLGEILHTTIRVKEEIFQLTLVDAEVKIKDEVIMTAEMKIALSNIEASTNSTEK